jgi:hypothetical protein
LIQKVKNILNPNHGNQSDATDTTAPATEAGTTGANTY